jgi:RNA polymerase sigma factor FliA
MERCEVNALWRETGRALMCAAMEDVATDLSSRVRPILTRLVRRLRLRIPSFADEDDLLQEVSMNVCRAVKTHNKARGSLEKRLVFTVQNGVLAWLRTLNPLGRQRAQHIRDVEAAYARLEQLYGRAPRDEELGTHLGWTAPQVRHVLDAMDQRDIISWESLAPDVHAGTSNPDVFEQVWMRDCSGRLGPAFASLSPVESQVLVLHYFENVSLRHISERLRISQSQVRRVHQQALLRLRSLLGEQPQIPAVPTVEEMEARLAEWDYLKWDIKEFHVGGHTYRMRIPPGGRAGTS